MVSHIQACIHRVDRRLPSRAGSCEERCVENSKQSGGITHSDIVARNILVDDRGDVVAILDWEMAGWMPEQWEYVKAMWMGQYDEGWPEFVHLFLKPYDNDLRMHTEMCRLHGSPFKVMINLTSLRTTLGQPQACDSKSL